MNPILHLPTYIIFRRNELPLSQLWQPKRNQKKKPWWIFNSECSNRPYGEVDLHFSRQFEGELHTRWSLIDKDGNRHSVTYRKSKHHPLITWLGSAARVLWVNWCSFCSSANLPADFSQFVRNKRFKSLFLRGPAGWEKQCSILIRNASKKSTKIGKGWKQFCSEHGFGAGDDLCFHFENVNVVYVNKKN